MLKEQKGKEACRTLREPRLPNGRAIEDERRPGQDSAESREGALKIETIQKTVRDFFQMLSDAASGQVPDGPDASLAHAERRTRAVRPLPGFGGPDEQERPFENINDMVDEISMMSDVRTKKIIVHRKYQKGIWPVEVEQAQIREILWNLYMNAWQAMPAGGDLYLETTNVFVDENGPASTYLRPGQYVKISMTDTGVHHRVFVPFFTAGGTGGETYPGLDRVYGIVRSNGGIISMGGGKGSGTTVNVYLSASEKKG